MVYISFHVLHLVIDMYLVQLHACRVFHLNMSTSVCAPMDTASCMMYPHYHGDGHTGYYPYMWA